MNTAEEGGANERQGCPEDSEVQPQAVLGVCGGSEAMAVQGETEILLAHPVQVR